MPGRCPPPTGASPGAGADLSGCDSHASPWPAAGLARRQADRCQARKHRSPPADLTGATSPANAKWARLDGANLAGANLSDADLFHAIFDRADLSQAKLTGAYLFGANLIDTCAWGLTSAGLPTWDILMEGIDLSGGSVRNCLPSAAS